MTDVIHTTLQQHFGVHTLLPGRPCGWCRRERAGGDPRCAASRGETQAGESTSTGKRRR